MDNLSIRIRETKQAIINTINASELHIDIVDAVLSDIGRSVHELAEKNYHDALRQKEDPEIEITEGEPEAITEES